MGLLFMLGMKNYRIFVVLTLLIILNGQSSLEARAGADRKVLDNDYYYFLTSNISRHQ